MRPIAHVVRTVRGHLPVAALLLAFAAGCSTTRFPEQPEEHRLYAELQAAGHEYYFNVHAGVRSLVSGMLPQSDAQAAVDEVRRRWSDIDRLDAVDRIAEYLREHELGVVAERIELALLQNQDNLPPDGVDERLESAAVKQGLVDAAFVLEE